MKIILFKDVSTFVRLQPKFFGDRYRVYGSRSGENSRSSNDPLKNMAVGLESLVSHLGIINTLKTKKNEKSLNLFAVYSTICERPTQTNWRNG